MSQITTPADEEFPFDVFLEGLNNAEARRRSALEQELKEKYVGWAYHIGLLKEQFGEVWDLFHEITGKVDGWFRDSASYSQWGFMGASGYGYNFGANIQYGSLGYVSKSLIVSFGCSMPNGVGDERDLGRRSELNDTLVGLENCHFSLPQQLSGVERMLEYMSRKNLVFKLYNLNIGRGVHCEPIEFLETPHVLRHVCQGLFKALNSDESVEIPKYLPPRYQRIEEHTD